MKILFIFDATGFIYTSMSGNVREPEGLTRNKMWVEVPEGKQVTNFDTIGETPVPVFVDIPKSEVQTLQERVNDLNIAMAAIMGGAV